MALSQSALSELLDAIRAGGSEDVMREAMTFVLQELIELEAAQTIGAAMSAATAARPTATAVAAGCCRPRPATSSCASPNCARARSSRPCSNRDDASTARCGR